MSWLAYTLLLFGLSWAGVGLFRWYAIDKGMLDEPNERSSHIAPTARGGGVIFFLGWALLLFVFYYYGMIEKNVVWFFAPVLCVGLLGFWEDHWGVSAVTRFFTVGEEIEAKLMGVDRKNRTILLSIKAKESQEEADALRDYGKGEPGNATLGDLLKEQLRDNQEEE